MTNSISAILFLDISGFISDLGSESNAFLLAGAFNVMAGRPPGVRAEWQLLQLSLFYSCSQFKSWWAAETGREKVTRGHCPLLASGFRWRDLKGGNKAHLDLIIALIWQIRNSCLLEILNAVETLFWLTEISLCRHFCYLEYDRKKFLRTDGKDKTARILTTLKKDTELCGS